MSQIRNGTAPSARPGPVGARAGARGTGGRGLGKRLLADALADADAAGQPCHLATWKPANVVFYERLGFRVQREARPLGAHGPTRWTLRRAPAD